MNFTCPVCCCTKTTQCAGSDCRHMVCRECHWGCECGSNQTPFLRYRRLWLVPMLRKFAKNTADRYRAKLQHTSLHNDETLE